MRITLGERKLSDSSSAWSVLINHDDQTVEMECIDKKHALMLHHELTKSLVVHSIYGNEYETDL